MKPEQNPEQTEERKAQLQRYKDAAVKGRRKGSPTNELTKHIKESFQKIGGDAFRINTQGTYSQKLGKYIKSGSDNGVSDLIAVYEGKFIAIEVKSEATKDKIRPDQEKFRNRVTGSKGVYFIARSKKKFNDWLVLELAKPKVEQFSYPEYLM